MVKPNVFGEDDSEEEIEKPVIPRRKLFIPEAGTEENVNTIDAIDGKDYMELQIHDTTETKPKNLLPASMKTGLTEKYDVIQKKTTEAGLKRSLFGAIDSQAEAEELPNKKSKGLSMMEKMGFKVGEGLGRNKDSIKEPVSINTEQNKANSRMGIRVKDNTILDQPHTSVEIDAKEFQNRLTETSEIKRNEQTLRTMQKTMVNLGWLGYGGFEELLNADMNVIPVWLRTYVWNMKEKLQKTNEEKEQEDEEEPYSKPQKNYKLEEDEEVSEYDAEPIAKRVVDANKSLRDLNYCYYCGTKYKDAAEMAEFCPGEQEFSHQ
ncbi:unnamed protein product [Kuraishia capsulata CBS 1993]|uniref:G-patch domain-containing protein n=1 Tax=Kuraishia capsulata CBS 1993 TaxID=1382522 RepID=W6MJQ6_9ASCO|nr:uncharacterized protein KUCA_T00002468001 [Kuraishia capsulata CBS 1993]CDK26496.1 unnamed protein product [Kuraishia capsulata CBS 1993]